MLKDSIECQILITGCYRTGSEYLTQLINNHPRISATFYTVNFMRFCFGRYDPIEKEENWSRLIEDALEKLKVRFGRVVSFDEVTRFLPEGEVSYAALYQALILAQHSYPGMTHWAEKTQLVWTRIPDFLGMYPAGRAIHIIRDPRSVLASFKRYTHSQPPRYMGAMFNCLGSMQYAQKYLAEYPQHRYKLVRYEDVAQNVEKVMAEIFDFLGVDVPPHFLSTEGWKDSHNQPWIANTAFGNPESFSVEKSIQRWRDNLTPGELFLCELVNSSPMERFGYPLSGSSVKPGDLEDTLKSALSDEQIASFFGFWASKGEGAECFPLDPFDPKTWEDVAIRQRLKGRPPHSEFYMI